jgi:Rad3-related DNA helicase
LENDHVITKTQAMVGIVTEGVDGTVFNFKYENRNNYNLLGSVGKSLLALDKMISGGILVFFPSYSLLSKTVKLWKDSKVSVT